MRETLSYYILFLLIVAVSGCAGYPEDSIPTEADLGTPTVEQGAAFVAPAPRGRVYRGGDFQFHGILEFFLGPAPQTNSTRKPSPSSLEK